MRSHKNLGQIGSVVLTLIGYQQTDNRGICIEGLVGLYRGNGVINTKSYSRFGSPERRIGGIIQRERSNKYYILFQVWFSGEKDWWNYTEGTE